MTVPPLTFAARHVPGAGRGRTLGTPTINLEPEDVPAALADGVYACRAILDGETQPRDAVLHKGPRPVFRDTPSCEVHLLEPPPDRAITSVTVEVVALLRGPETFALPSPDALMAQIREDVARARAILRVA